MTSVLSLLIAASGIQLFVPAAHFNSLERGATSFTQELTRDQARVVLAKMSITPESVCVAGVSGEEVTALLQGAVETLDALAPSFEASQAAVVTARSELALLRSQGSSGGNESLLQQAEAALAAALASQSLLWQNAFEATVAHLSESQRSLLATMRSNARQNAPVEYRVVIRTNAEWAALQRALQGARAREVCGLGQNSEMQAVISTAGSDPAVYAARQRLESGLAAVRAAWDAPVQP